jgi:hypothetical protein
MKTKTRYNKKRKMKKLKRTRKKRGGAESDAEITSKIMSTQAYLTSQMSILKKLLLQSDSSSSSQKFKPILDELKNLAETGDYQGLMKSDNFSVKKINNYESKMHLSSDVVGKIRHILTTCYTISKTGDCATASLDTYKHDADFKQQIMKEPETKEERTKRKDAARDALVEEGRKKRFEKLESTIPTLPETKILSGRPSVLGRLKDVDIRALTAGLEADKATATAKYGDSYTSAVVDTSSPPIMPPPLLQPLQARPDWKYSGRT